MRLVKARVLQVTDQTADLQRLVVRYEDARGHKVEGRALSYLQITEACHVDDMVLLNATAVDLSLGTGGVLFVVALIPTDVATAPEVAEPALRNRSSHPQEADAKQQLASCTVFDDPAPEGGHIIKLRYTPMQRDVLSVEEPASPYHQQLRELRSLAGKPVVCCELHSQVPLVAAAVRSVAPHARITYCQTDQAALMLAFSNSIRAAKESGLIDATISCGQALGGDFEAVTLHSGLLAAAEITKADVIIVGIGPGIVGTDTAFGHGGVAQGEALNAVGSLAGTAIAALRLSFADQRARHRGVSHHSICALSDICLIEAYIPVPSNLPIDQRAIIDRALAQKGIAKRHRLTEVAVDEQSIDLCGLEVTTMGRDQSEDPAFFSAAYAAGVLAGGLCNKNAR